MRRLVLICAALAAPVVADAQSVPKGLKVDRVVLLMRHGVRPPTKAPSMPEGVADRPWPSWSVPPGYLTPHGATAVRRVAEYDRTRWSGSGMVLRGACPTMRVIADSDQRTIATAQSYVAGAAPGCTVTIEHKPQDVPDPLFAPLDQPGVAFDAEEARLGVMAEAGPGGISGHEARMRPLLARIDAILCAAPSATCGVVRERTELAPPKPGKRPKLTGALDRASTAAQILLLEYADGKPMAEVGWGRATPADIARLAAFHAEEFRLLARPRYIAKANLSLLAPLMAAAVTKPGGAAVTMIAGHDTNVASLGGLLGLHWQVPGLAADDPAPGGAIVFERLVDAKGARYVRALYRSQTVAQIRALSDLRRAVPYVAVMPIEGCTARGVEGLCTERAFVERLTG